MHYVARTSKYLYIVEGWIHNSTLGSQRNSPVVLLSLSLKSMSKAVTVGTQL